MSYQCIPLEKLEDGLSSFRLTTPSRIAAIEGSLATSGQLQPVIVRSYGKGYQLLDGFKRFYAARSLHWQELECRVIDADDVTAKIMLLACNSHGGGLEAYEQGGVIYSLKREHHLDESRIADLLHRSVSWVSRRLSLIERLDESVSDHLRLGHITSTHARELSRLPRGKQDEFLKIVLNHGLTSRQTALLVGKYLGAKNIAEQTYLMAHPMEIIERATLEGEVYDCRLGSRGNRLLKTSRLLVHYQHVFIGICNHSLGEELSPQELKILSPGFGEIARKAQIIQSLLKLYVHERRVHRK